MIENGASIYRVEDTIKRILTSYNVKSINVFCINSLIILSTENVVLTKRITINNLDLFEIDCLNTQSRCLCNHIPYIKPINNYNIIIKIFSILIATGSFCIYFGGNWLDALFSGIIGLIITFKKSIVNGVFARTFSDCVIAGFLAFIPSLFLKSINPDKIMIGTIMLLIPGLTIGNAMKDIMYSDTLSGILELVEAIFIALAIAFGFSISVFIFGSGYFD